MKRTVLLDNGHGGIINGVYQTSGKRSPQWEDGSQLFEGEFTRHIVNGIISKLTELDIPYVNIAPELEDISLSTRVNRANNYSNSVYVSVHANAGGGKGFEIFTSHGSTKSDVFAEVFVEEFAKEFPTIKIRADKSDGDSDKEANFYVLKNTRMPAVLTENFFMDTEHECREYLMTENGRQRIIDFHVKAIQRIVKM